MADRPDTLPPAPSLAPGTVAGQEFPVVRKGYDPDGVRSYLQRVASALQTFAERDTQLGLLLAEAREKGSAATPAAPAPVVAAASKPAARTSLPEDEDELLALLGEETTRILRSAKEAAASITGKAEENAARILGEAHTEAERLRAEAETVLADRKRLADKEALTITEAATAEATRVRTAADADATAVREAAVRDAERIRADADEQRERTLSEVARRKRVAQAQIEALRAGRERLIEAYRVVRTTLDEVTDELGRADAEARAANDAVLERARTVIDEIEDEPYPDVTLDTPAAGTPALAPVDDDAPAPPPTVRTKAVRRPEDMPTMVFTPTGELAVVHPRDADEGVRIIGDRAGEKDAGHDIAMPSAPVGLGPLHLPDHLPKPAPLPVKAPVIGGVAFAVPEAKAAVAEADGGAGPVDEVVIVEESVVAAVAVVVEEAVDDPGAPAAEDHAPADEPEPEPEVATHDTAADSAADSADRAAAVTSEEEDEASEVDEVEGAEAVEAAEGAVAPEAEPEPEPAAEPGAPKPAVDELFARIRADRAQAVARAQEVLAAEPEPETPTEPASDLVPDAVPEAVPEAAADDEPEPDPEDDEHLLESRDKVLEPIATQLSRRLKRALQDEQNDLLDRLRNAKPPIDVDVALPASADQQARVTAVAVPFLDQAAAAGVTAAPVAADRDPAPVDVGALAARVAGELTGNVVGALRSRLEKAVADVGGPGHEHDLVDRVGAAYREWRGTRLEKAVDEAVIAAYSTAAFAAVPAGSQLRWIADDGEQSCPDCDDNVLAGVQRRGEEFPTGQQHPPAHAGCRCLLALPSK